MESNIAWASTHLSNATFCLADKTSQPFADDTFDVIISNAVLYHMGNLESELSISKELLRILRPGGCAWHAWLGRDDDKVTQTEWNSATLSGATVTTFNEMEVFGEAEYGAKDSYSVMYCKQP